MTGITQFESDSIGTGASLCEGDVGLGDIDRRDRFRALLAERQGQASRAATNLQHGPG